MLAEPDSQRTRELFKIASLATAFGLGCAAASLQSLDRSPAGFNFHVTVWTFVAFAFGAAIALLFWHVCMRSPAAARRYSGWFLLVGLVMFLYPLRFIPSERKLEMVEGLILAIMALSGVAFMLWQVKRYLDDDTAQFERDSAKAKLPTAAAAPPVKRS